MNAVEVAGNGVDVNKCFQGDLWVALERGVGLIGNFILMLDFAG